MSRRWILFLSVVAAVVVLDHWTKFLAVQHLTDRFDAYPGVGAKLGALYGDPPELAGRHYHFDPRGKVEVVDGLLRLRYAENPGMAWGMMRTLPASVRMPLFHVVTLAAIVLITWYFRKLKGTRQERWATWGLPLVLGGAIGNYVDRGTRAFVIDYIEAHWFDRAYFPSFNVADAAITIGVACLILDALVRKEEKAPAAPAKSA